MSTNNLSVAELEQRAAREREEVAQDLSRVRKDLRRELDVRHRFENEIRTRPALFYGVAAGCSLLIGYFFARLLKA